MGLTFSKNGEIQEFRQEHRLGDEANVDSSCNISDGLIFEI